MKIRELLFPVAIALLTIASFIAVLLAFEGGKANLEMVFISIQSLLWIIAICAVRIAFNSEQND